jgi:cephalosporin hydroxylase
MTLTELAKKYGCDKFFTHSYMPHYEELLAKRKVKRLLEVGIGYEGLMKPFVPFYIHGASLKMWSTYWPEAEIWACDIRPDTLINEGNIKSVVCDQSSGRSLAEMVFEVTEGLLHKLDVVIDDGSHQVEHQKLTASAILPRLAKGGVMVIEDTYRDKGAELARSFGGRLIVGDKRPDDCLVIIER